MAYETYTFPDQEINAGTVGIVITTSNGTGSTTLTQKYFSAEAIVKDATELLGGDIQSGYLSVKIDFDYDNLFSDTILPILDTLGEYVLMKVTLEGEVLFNGAILASTIRKEPFYATNDSIDNQNNAVEFNCVWALSLLKNVPTDGLAAEEPLSLDLFNASSYYVMQPFAGAATNKIWWMSLVNIIRVAMARLTTDYSITYNLIFDETNYTFFSRDAERQGLEFGYTYPYQTPLSGIDGEIDFVAFESGSCVGVPFYRDYDPDTEGEARTVAACGVFSRDSGSYLPSAYDVVVAIIKSMGLYCHISYGGGVDLIIKIGQRISSEETQIQDVISVEETPFTESARGKLNIQSSVCSNTFFKTNTKAGSSEYTDRPYFDFHDDNGWLGAITGGTLNGEQSLMYPSSDGTVFHLIREMGIGSNLLTNPNFENSMNGWTQTAGVWTSQFVVDRYQATVDLNNTAYVELSQTLSETVYDNLIFCIRVGKVNVSTAMTVEFTFYSGATALYSETKNLEAAYLLYNSPLYAVYRNRYLNTKYEKTFGGITKVSVKITQFVEETLYLSGAQLKIERRGTPELVGYTIDDYFNNPTTKKRTYVLNGIQKNILPRMFHYYNGDKYYVKSRELELHNNQTNIETVNYPY